MLIKYEGPHKFIFVANTKCASNSIEGSRLGRGAEIKLTSAWAGKHMSIEEAHERFGFLFAEVPFDSFFKFGIIRDPLQWVVSWYNFRARPELADPNHRNHANYTGDMSFADFWSQNRDEPFLDPQSGKFLSEHNPEIRVDFLMRMERMSQDLSTVLQVLGEGPLKTGHKNKSLVKRLRADDVEPAIKAEAQEKYRSDYDLIGCLETFNAEGLERFRRDVVSQAAPQSTLDRLKNAVVDTPLEAPARVLVNYVKTRRRAARQG